MAKASAGSRDSDSDFAELNSLQLEVANLTGGGGGDGDAEEGFQSSRRSKGKQSREQLDFDDARWGGQEEKESSKPSRPAREDAGADEGGSGFARRPKYEDRRPQDREDGGGGGFKKPSFDRDDRGFEKRKPFERDGDFKPRKAFSDDRGGFEKRKPWENRGEGGDGGGGFTARKPWENREGGEGGFNARKPFEREGRGGEGGFEKRKPFGDDGGFKARKSFGDDRGEGGFEKRKPWEDRGDGGFKARKSFGDDRGEGGFKPRKPFGDDRGDGGLKAARKPFGEEDNADRQSSSPATPPPRRQQKPPAFQPEPRTPRAPRAAPQQQEGGEEDESAFGKLTPLSPKHDFIYSRDAVWAALTHLDDDLLRTSTRLVCASTLDDSHEIIKLAKSKYVPVERSSRMRLGDAVGPSAAKLHDGLLLDMPRIEYTTIKKDTVVRTPAAGDETAAAPVTLMLALDEVVDPTNLASILRSAHYFGVYTVLASEKNSAPLSPLVTYASRGASIVLGETNRLLGTKNLSAALEAHKRAGWRVIGTAAEADERVVPIESLDLDAHPKTILLMGSEGSGLRDSVKQHCDYFVHLPRPTGRAFTPPPLVNNTNNNNNALAESKIALNVSAATSALLARLLK